MPQTAGHSTNPSSSPKGPQGGGRRPRTATVDNNVVRLMENILRESSWEEQGTIAYIIADTHILVVPIDVLLLQQGDIATELIPLMKRATSKEEAAWWLSLATAATKCIRKARAEFQNEEVLAETRKRRMAPQHAEARGRQAGGSAQLNWGARREISPMQRGHASSRVSGTRRGPTRPSQTRPDPKWQYSRRRRTRTQGPVSNPSIRQQQNQRTLLSVTGEGKKQVTVR